MKKKIKIALAAAIVGFSTIGASIPVIIQVSNNKNHTQENTSKDFNENIDEYIKNATTPENFSIFNQNNETLKPHSKIPLDPNNPIYHSLFNRINKNVILNDFYWYISKSFKNNENKSFKARINNLSVVESNDLDKRFKIELNFELYNSNPFEMIYKINKVGSETALIKYGPHEIKENKILIESNAFPHFNQIKNSNNDIDLYVNYFFKNATWKVDDSKINFDNFYLLSDYSRSIKTKIINASDGVGYLDIKEFANKELSKLSINDFVNDITNKVNDEVNKIIINLEPVQKILQELVKNKPTKDFLNDSAKNISSLVVNNLSNSVDNIGNIEPIIIGILQDKKLFEILSNSNNKDSLIEFIENIVDNEQITSLIADIMNSMPLDDEQLFNTWIDETLNSFGAFIPQNLATFIQGFKENGILTNILTNYDELRSGIDGIVDTSSEIFSMIDSLVLLINKNGGLNTNIVDLIINACKDVDDSGKNPLKEIINKFVTNENIKSLVNDLIFDNSSLTTSNLIKSINALANPKDDSGETINYVEWFNSLEKDKVISKDSSFDPNTRKLKLNIDFKYKITNNMNIEFSNIFKFLPSKTIDIFGTKVPLGVLKSLLPTSLKFKNNDWISFGVNIDSVVNYDVIYSKELDNYVLSWKAPSQMIYDINLPQSAKSLYDSSSFLISNMIYDLSFNLLFHRYRSNQVFYPNSSKLSNTIVKNFNPYEKSDQAILSKNVSIETMDKIKTKINEAITSIPLEEIYSFGNYKINKVETQNNFDPQSIISDLFDLTYFKDRDDELSFKTFLNSEILIPNMSIIGIQINQVNLNSICFELPYNIYSNDGIMKRIWNFNF